MLSRQQLVAEPWQVWQVELQLRQTLAPCASALRYAPIAHTVVHVPRDALKDAPATHDEQAEEPAPEHVAHDASHAWHVSLASAYLPAGHAETHAPSS